MTGIGRLLKTMRRHHLAHLFVSIYAGMGLGFSQTDAPKDVDGWSKAKWDMTAGQVMQAFKDEGASPSKGFGLQCDPAVEIPTFQFGTQDKKSTVAKAKFRVTFDADQWSGRLCGITIRPTRTVRFDDLKAMLIKQYGEPKSVDTDKLMPTAHWFFPSTSISLVGDWDNVDAIYFFAKKTEERKKLFNPPVIQSDALPATPAPEEPSNARPASATPERQPNPTSPGTPSAILSGKAFLITKGGDLMLARLAQVFVLSGEAANQFSKNAQFVDYEESIDYLRAIAPSSGTEQAMLRLQCVENLMKHFEMAVDLKKAYPSSVVSSETDEEGAFKVKGLKPDRYTVLVFGRGGANAALWMDQISLEVGKDDPLKMHSTKIGCFDPQGLGKF